MPRCLAHVAGPYQLWVSEIRQYRQRLKVQDTIHTVTYSTAAVCARLDILYLEQRAKDLSHLEENIYNVEETASEA
jgi:hypothetical protein